ncbi:gem-associated protein 8 [Tamandua tetradactyla]|uniref:gem-associated protein 8 n=1 Tax=Tamandua tetradactyla TaxID=48850 RepID=UPI0040547606
MEAKESPSVDAEPWYFHPVYARYWQHYHQAMAWLQSHQNAYRKALESYYNCPWYFASAIPPHGSYEREYPQSFDHNLASQNSPCRDPHSRKTGPYLHDSLNVQASMREVQEEETESESDGEIECDLSNMEITEELRQYFAEVERHREERRRQQQLDKERLEDYVSADHDLYYNPHRSVAPPSERPGERRQAEMKRLYGDSAAKIQAMEAAVQLSFDKHCDRKQPKYWPVIPLKF